MNLLGLDSFTPEELKEIASRGMATHIVRGSLSKADMFLNTFGVPLDQGVPGFPASK